MILCFVNSTSAAQRSAIDVLGWHAGNAVELDLLGARLLVVATPARDEIARRNAEGLPPIADPWLLRCHADLDPWFLSRPSPVRLLGALAFRQGWVSARDAASRFTAFGPRAIALPPRACRPAVLTEAAVTGMGVIRLDGDAATLLASPGQPVAVKRTHVHRLVEETVWNAMTYGAESLAETFGAVS
jgi:hypothetical protein